MNEQERTEMERLKERQKSLQLQLNNLRRDIEALEVRIESAQTPTSPIVEPLEIPALEVPPLPVEAEPDKTLQAPPSAIPPVIAEVSVSIPGHIASVPTPQVSSETAPIRPTPTPSVPPVYEPAAATGTAKQDASFEMKLGTYWLVRIGIVVLLTGLVFLGNYAYQNWIGLLGPGAKVGLLYLASGALLGTGAWLQRKREKESLRNYGQVLLSGGLAAVYFVTYATHYVSNLRIIESPVIDGLLLLGWAGAVIALAERKKSELMALFAIGLAYYTSAITHIGSFTLYSNLVLTIAAVTFLVRNRWATLSFVALLANYIGFAFWRFYRGELGFMWPTDELWHGNYFLAGYWIVFTIAVFLSRSDRLRGATRASFLTINNGAFFSLIVLSMWQVRHGGFWKFSLGYGVALLALAALAKRILVEDSITKNAYFAQGLLLATVGLIAHFTGFQLSLLLAAESVILMFFAHQTKNLISEAAGYIVALLAVFIAITVKPSLVFGSSVALLVGCNAVLCRRSEKLDLSSLSPSAFYFAALASAMLTFTIWQTVHAPYLAPTLALLAVALTVSIYLIKTPELVVVGQVLLIVGIFQWVTGETNSAPWWETLMLIVVTLGLSHWWQRQNRWTIPANARNLVQGAYAIGIVTVLFLWFSPTFGQRDLWLAFSALLAIAVTGYGLLTRSWFLAAFGQIFVVISGWEFASQLMTHQPHWYWALSPILVLLVISIATARWFTLHPNATDDVRKPLLGVAVAYRWCAVAMSLWWISAYIPERQQFWVLTLIGSSVYILGGIASKRIGVDNQRNFLLRSFWFVSFHKYRR